MKLYKFALLSVICLSVAASQPPKGEKFEEKRDRMEMMVMWKITEELKLTEDQAEKFFPVFHHHREEVRKIKDEQRTITGSLREKVERGDAITDQELTDQMEKLKVLELKKIDAREQLFNKMEGTLNNVQRFKLLGMEHQLRNEIQKEIRKHKRHQMKDRPSKKGFWNN